MNRLLVALLLIAAGFTPLFSQEFADVDFGKVDQAELDALPTGRDSAAEAYTLFDRQQLRWDVDPEGLKLRNDYHRRVKLLRESSFERADVEIYYDRDDEAIVGLQAMIHQPDGSKEKIRARDMTREQVEGSTYRVKFTFPGVRLGSVIEYTFVRRSERLTVPNKYFFQEDIPVRYCEWDAAIPEYFNYVNLSNAAGFTVQEKTRKNQQFAGRTIPHGILRFAYHDLAAYVDQPYVNNFRDYLPHMRLQLRNVMFPGRGVEKVFSDWPTTVKELMEHGSFGRVFEVKGNYNRVWKTVEPLLATATTPAAKVAYLYNFVSGKISWNDNYSFTAEQTPDQLLTTASGSSGEMSIMLLSLLREAGIEAYPVLVGLRDNGSPVELYPLLDQFQHVMVLARVGEGQVLLDPNDISRPPGLPRIAALNGRAFVVDPANPHWIDVTPPQADKVMMANMTIGEDGMAEVDVQARLRGYYAVNGRHSLRTKEKDSDMPIVDEIISVFPEAQLTTHEVMDEDVSGPLKVSYHLRVPVGEAMDEFMYLQPNLITVFDKELADTEQRLYPVDFAYPRKERFVTKIKLPAGYVVEELPQSVQVTSPDKSISCRYTASADNPGEIGINFTVTVNRVNFPAQEYGLLQEMFRHIIELQSSSIVLKRSK